MKHRCLGAFVLVSLFSPACVFADIFEMAEIGGGSVSVRFSTGFLKSSDQYVKIEGGGVLRLQAVTGNPDHPVKFVNFPLIDPVGSARPLSVCFKGLQLEGTKSDPAIEDCQTFVKSVDVLDKMKAIPMPQSDKDIYASGFGVTSQSGTAGGADININWPNNVRGLVSTLQIKKASGAGADAKNFELGEKFHVVQAIDNHEITGIIYDVGAKLEGEASKFDVTNVVGDATVKFHSMIHHLGDSKSGSGFLFFQLITGFEGGSNRANGSTTPPLNSALPPPHVFGGLQDVDWIARAKWGANMTLRYINKTSHLPFDEIELTSAGVGRYLFYKEARFNSTTQQIDTTTIGFRPWVQTDLKLFLGHTGTARYGFKMTYQRGSLPPVFSATRTFQFGLVYESKSAQEKAQN